MHDKGQLRQGFTLPTNQVRLPLRGQAPLRRLDKLKDKPRDLVHVSKLTGLWTVAFHPSHLGRSHVCWKPMAARAAPEIPQANLPPHEPGMGPVAQYTLFPCRTVFQKASCREYSCRPLSWATPVARKSSVREGLKAQLPTQVCSPSPQPSGSHKSLPRKAKHGIFSAIAIDVTRARWCPLRRGTDLGGL